MKFLKTSTDNPASFTELMNEMYVKFCHLNNLPDNLSAGELACQIVEIRTLSIEEQVRLQGWLVTFIELWESSYKELNT